MVSCSIRMAALAAVLSHIAAEAVRVRALWEATREMFRIMLEAICKFDLRL